MPDNSRAPIQTTLGDFRPKKNFANDPDCPFTEAEFEWIFRQRAQNGFSKAFIQFNSKGFLVDVPTLIQCLVEMRGAM